MQVKLVCKESLDDGISAFTKGQEYDFHFGTIDSASDGYIIQDDGKEHWLTLPSNMHNFPFETFRVEDYFAEVVID